MTPNTSMKAVGREGTRLQPIKLDFHTNNGSKDQLQLSSSSVTPEQEEDSKCRDQKHPSTTNTFRLGACFG